MILQCVFHVTFAFAFSRFLSSQGQLLETARSTRALKRKASCSQFPCLSNCGCVMLRQSELIWQGPKPSLPAAPQQRYFPPPSTISSRNRELLSPTWVILSGCLTDYPTLLDWSLQTGHPLDDPGSSSFQRIPAPTTPALGTHGPAGLQLCGCARPINACLHFLSIRLPSLVQKPLNPAPSQHSFCWIQPVLRITFAHCARYLQ